MSLRFLYMNFHIAPFIIAFFAGFILLVLAPLTYQLRKKKLFITPLDVLRYDDLERRLLLWGAILAFGGIVGAAIITESYGYNYRFTDINGKTSIVNSKDGQYSNK